MVTDNLARLAIMGAGGLGIEMLSLLTKRPAAKLVAILDKGAYLYKEDGFSSEEIQDLYKKLSAEKNIAVIPEAIQCENSIVSFISEYSKNIDSIFYALPNLPNSFIPDITRFIANETDFKGVIVDALKRTAAVKLLKELDQDLKQAGILYLTGCGATPGLLTTAANIAAQSFVEIKSVKITFGVGIANWQAYRATVREDIAHLAGFNVQMAQTMSEEEVEKLLEERKGILELVDMEHADDIMLEWAGICDASKVTVGGIVDTRNAKKPISTNVQITGITYQGRESTHQFILGDETTMAANVNGTVLGFMNAGLNLYQEYNACGLKTSAEIMPRFTPVQLRTQVSV